jgi:hypothetical protein
MFDVLGTFSVDAMQQILDTLCPEYACVVTKNRGYDSCATIAFAPFLLPFLPLLLRSLRLPRLPRHPMTGFGT